MKVVEVITDTNIGGAGVLLVNRLRHTDLARYKTTVLLPKGSALVARLSEIGVNIIEMNCAYDKSFDPFAIFKYWRVLRRLRPDLINCHGALSARIAARLCGVSVKLCTRHCVFPVKNKHRFVRSIIGGLNSFLSDKFIAVAFAAKDNLLELGISEQKIAVIINGAERLSAIDGETIALQRKRLGIGDDQTVLVMNARLEPYKGHIWFFEAIKELIDEGVPIKVLLLGDGSERAHLSELASAYGIDDAVIFTGFVDNVATYMNLAHININCSTGTETSSLALSEGMSLGLPAIVSDYGGNPYMVRHGENGFVCPVYAHSTLARYVKMLINDSSLYAAMSQAAMRRFETELNAQAMTKNTTALYDGLYLVSKKRGHMPSIFVDIEK